MSKPRMFVRGDTHGIETEFSEADQVLQKGDYLFICGDFGFLFMNDSSEARFLDELQTRPYTVLFVDGNHENFDALNEYPVTVWNGGKVHRIRENVIHLCRGQVFNIEGKTFFTFGGGYSIDSYMRSPHRSWWPEELPSREEYDEGKKNLDAHDRKVDVILTHTCNIETIKLLAAYDRYSSIKPATAEEAPRNYFLEDVRETVTYKRWFFGHFHVDRDIDLTRQSALYERLLNLDEVVV